MMEDDKRTELCDELKKKCEDYRNLSADGRQFIFVTLDQMEQLLDWVQKLREEIMNLELEIRNLMSGRSCIYANDEPVIFEEVEDDTISDRSVCGNDDWNTLDSLGVREA